MRHQALISTALNDLPPRRSLVLLLTISMLLSSCSGSSVLINADDKTFQENESRLEKVTTLVKKTGASPAEQTLFLQAESFYRYRFEPPERGRNTFLAEAAGALTDFPAFQALAGELDLQDIRLKSSDAAIQLWETLLKRYPNTSIRPLTLYRLGWAYRNSGVSSLPRENPNDAFGELVKTSPTSSLAALARDAEQIPYKSKETASGWSIIPGGGQFYVGETGNGMVRLGVALAAVAAVVIPVVIASRRGSDLSWKHDWPLLGTGVLGLSVLSFDYTSSYEDAMRAVVQWNEKHESDFNQAHPDAP
jgi:hypothetical protein